MPVSLVDSSLFCDVFGTRDMREIFSDEGLLARYLQVEAALARVQARLGIIPVEAAREIVACARIENLDMAELKRETELVGRSILPLVHQLARACGGGAGEYVHWGATTPDIMDTGTVLQVRDGLVLVDQDLAELEDILAERATAHRDDLMIARTNGQHATPITFGFKVAGWLDELHRHRIRIAEMRPRVLVGQFGGAVGSLAAQGGKALELRTALMHELALGDAAISWHVARDRIAEVIFLLGMITATLGRIANEVWLLTKTEIGELAEPFAQGRGASSTMPQKRNPRGSEAILGIARIVRQHAATALDSMLQEHERGGGPWIAQWAVLPEAFVFTAGALNQSRIVLRDLYVDTARMRQNMLLTHGMTSAEAVMMALAPTIGRQRAHDVVYAACRRAEQSGEELGAVLIGEPEITACLGPQAITRLLDPENYVGFAREFIDRVLVDVGLGTSGTPR